MRLLLLAAVVSLALAASPANAQPPMRGAFGPPLLFDLSPIVGVADYQVQPVEADIDSPLKEIGVYMPASNLFSVGRWHPDKHGVGGTLDGPGLCLEDWTQIPDDAIPMFPTTDYTGDGIDDLVVLRPGGEAHVQPGHGLLSCR